MLTGSVYVDLRDVKDPDAARHRVATVAQVPTGARLVLVVGTLAVSPHLTWLLLEHVDRIVIDVWGEAWNVPRWLDALRADDDAWVAGGL